MLTAFTEVKSEQTPVRHTAAELEAVYHRYAKPVFRTCYLYTSSRFDAEDLTQSTFLQFFRKAPAFENEEHEKAWLLRTAINLCKNHKKHWWQKTVELQEEQEAKEWQRDETLQLVLALPQNYKSALYLHYYEGYSSVEIAAMLGLNENTVRGHLHSGRALLKRQLEEPENGK